MSARVNLLPETTRRRDRTSRAQGLVVFLFLVLVAALLGGHLLQRGQLEEQRERLREAEQELLEAQRDVAALSAFADLTDRLNRARTLVASTLGEQVTLAGILQDLAMVMPTDADVSSVSISLSPQLAEDGTTVTGVGTLGMSGESVGDIAPGIERLLLELDKVAGFRNVHVSNVTVGEDGITTYQLELELGPENRTRHYRDGIPEGMP